MPQLEQMELPLGLPPLPPSAPPVTADGQVDTSQAALESLRATNHDKFQRVAAPRADGTRVMPDLATIIGLRVDILLDVLLDPEARIRYELMFETMMSQILDEYLAQRHSPDLLVASAVAPSGPARLIVPGR